MESRPPLLQKVISGSETNHNLENGDSAIYPSYSCNISESQTIRERVESGVSTKTFSNLFFFLDVSRLFFFKYQKLKKKKTHTHTNKFRHPSRTYVAFVKIRDQKEEKICCFPFKKC